MLKFKYLIMKKNILVFAVFLGLIFSCNSDDSIKGQCQTCTLLREGFEVCEDDNGNVIYQTPDGPENSNIDFDTFIAQQEAGGYICE